MFSAIGQSSYSKGLNTKSVREKTIETSEIGLGVGGALGAIHGYTTNNWLKSNNEPSDKFVKNVKEGIRKTFTPEEHSEYNKVNKFFKDLVESTQPLQDFRKQIEDSKELKEALPYNEGENATQALDRIFSNENKVELKETLKNLQERTKIDKRLNDTIAKNRIIENLDKDKGRLVKSENTTDKMFKVLLDAKKNIKLKTSVNQLVIGGTLGAIIGLWVGASKYNKTPDKK